MSPRRRPPTLSGGPPDLQQPASTARRNFPTAWVCWLAMTAVGLGVVAMGRDLPYTDDLHLAAFVAGERPVRPAWLWAQWNDHRIPLVKVVLVPLYRAASYDCRSALLLNLVLLAGASALMIRTATAIRGQTAHADAFFPLAFLGWWSSALAWGFQFQFVSSVFFATLILAAATRPVGAWSAAVTGLALVGLPLCGANGLGLVPALAAWAAITGFVALRSPEGRDRAGGTILVASAALATLLVALYFRDFRRAESLTNFRPGPVGLAEALAMVASSGVGAIGWTVASVGSTTLADGFRLGFAATLAAGGVLALVMAIRGDHHRAGWGLVAVLVAQVCLFGGLAYGRAEGFLALWDGRYPSPVPGVNAALHQTDSHYAILAVPALCAGYLGFVLASRRGWRGVKLVPAGLALVMAIAAAIALPARVVDLERYHEGKAAFVRDVRGGLGVQSLVTRYYALLFCSTVAHDIRPALRSARDAHLGVLGQIRPDGNEPPVLHPTR